MSEKFMSITLDGYEFENRQSMNTNLTFLHVQPLNIPI